MMIENELAQYGVLGLWTLTLLAERYYNNKKISKLIDNNTVALTKTYEVITQCKKK